MEKHQEMLLLKLEFRKMLIKLVCTNFYFYRNNFIQLNIDSYCVQLLQNGNTKAINDLVLCGYTDVINPLKTIEDSDEDTHEFINVDIPQLMVIIRIKYLSDLKKKEINYFQ